MSITHSLDEKALRRESFTEGHKVTLADGQEWTFPKPILRFFPARTEDGRTIMGAEHGYDQAYEGLRDELIEVASVDVYNSTRIQVEIAGLLLLRNYDLSNKHLRTLLPLIPDDDANDEMWANLVPVIMANPPKPTPVGSEPPSWPTGS